MQAVAAQHRLALRGTRRPTSSSRVVPVRVPTCFSAPRSNIWTGSRALTAPRHGQLSQRRLAATTTVCKAGAGDTLVLGTSGQLAARIAVALLKAGAKVTAALDDEEGLQAIAFAKQLEIISASEAKQLSAIEIDPRDPESLASALPSRGRARVVLCLLDQSGGRRPDARAYAAVLDAIKANADRVGSLVVVSPAGGGAGVFGRGGGAGGPKLAPLEAAALEAAPSVLLIRTANLSDDRAAAGAGLVATTQGGVPATLAISRSAVAEAVVAATASWQGVGDAVIELGASEDVPARDAREVVGEALAEAQAAAEAPAEQEEEVPAAAPARFGLPAFGTRKQRVAVPVEAEVVVDDDDEEEEEEEAPKKRAPAFSFGTRRQKVQAAAEEEEEEEEEAPKKKAPAFSFGTRRQKAQAAADEEEEDAPKKKAPAFSFGTRKQNVEAVAEEQTAAPRRRALRQRSVAARQQVEPPAKAAPAPAREAEAAVPAKKSGGFLQSLGIGQETIYADE